MPFKKTNFSWIYNIEIFNRLEESLFAIIKIDNNTSLTFKDLYESKYFFSRKIIAKSFQYMKYLCGWSKRKPVLFGGRDIYRIKLFLQDFYDSRSRGNWFSACVYDVVDADERISYFRRMRYVSSLFPCI